MILDGGGLVGHMSTPAFAVTWDYRCPFAFSVHDHLVEALQAGADWDVTFVPFSLGQVHVAEGESDIWARPDEDSGLLALQAGIAVRDSFPDQFLAAHRALFRARHHDARQIRDADVVHEILRSAGLDADAVLAEVDGGTPLKTIQIEHERAVAEHSVWGVPTFIVGDQASFVRLMNRPDGDAARSIRDIERIVDLLTWPDLNEFKHTSIPK